MLRRAADEGLGRADAQQCQQCPAIHGRNRTRRPEGVFAGYRPSLLMEPRNQAESGALGDHSAQIERFGEDGVPLGAGEGAGRDETVEDVALAGSRGLGVLVGVVCARGL